MGSNDRRGSRRGAALIAALLFLAGSLSALDRKEYKVYVVVDILRPKFQEVVDGFREALDRELSASGARAAYTVFDTKTDPAAVQGILEAIRAGRPDLVCAVNSPAAFADRNISLKLSGPDFRIVSENCIPTQSGVAKEWQRPGGNITGVGVFVQMSSLLKMVKMIDPGYKKLVYFSWDRMTEINDWFVKELAEVKYLSSAEDEFDFLLECDRRGREFFGIEGISSWVHRDGSYADMAVEESRFIKDKMMRFPIYGYDEAGVRSGMPAGTCVVWHDLGAQLGEKGAKILQGARPGDLPWDYPRKYNIMLSLPAAKSLGIAFPQSLLGAAYRVYTDYEGGFLGSKR